MSVRKVDFHRFEIQKDPASYNDWCWTGLTLGKLMAIRRGLETNINGLTVTSAGLSRELFICVDRAIAQAKAEEAVALATAQAQRMMPKGV